MVEVLFFIRKERIGFLSHHYVRTLCCSQNRGHALFCRTACFMYTLLMLVLFSFSLLLLFKKTEPCGVKNFVNMVS